ncbi:MAG: hypothetical protein MUP85_14350 [Candidatus Lokiarchaeota archaeon]|nr:hypothetical protein [Candidatus Lokiarchaeota archaeon]
MTLKTEEAIKIAEKITDNLENNPFKLKNLRQYYRLVKLIEMPDEVKWINNELYGYKKSIEVPNYRRVRDSRDGTKFAFIGESYASIFVKAESENIFKYNPRPKDNNPFYTISVGPHTFLHVLNTVDNKIYRKTISILYKLKFEMIEFDIFEETRKAVNEKLFEICPEALNKLTETYEDLISSESLLDLQQISFACRTVLNDFADAVYPSTKEKVEGYDNKTHPLKGNNYVNRIIQFTYENIDSDFNSELIKSHLEYLFNYLKNIYELTNVGTHTEREKEHSKRCVIYTYLVIGDIINLTKL